MNIIQLAWNFFKRDCRTSKNAERKVYYIGNGASDILKENVSEEEGMYIEEPGPGALRLVVTQQEARTVNIKELFVHEEGVFLGYFLRKKTDHVWKWYAQDKKWYSTTELVQHETLEKYLFQAGEEIHRLVKNGEEACLVAQWKNKTNGEIMQDGYPIFSHKLMAHALGAYQGQTYANTREDLEYAYGLGYRYFETDVELTLDNKLVLSHGWSKKACEKTGMEYKLEFEFMTRNMFMQQNIKGMHVMDICDLREFMREHPDAYFEIDCHRKDSGRKLKVLYNEFKNDIELLDRLLIQAAMREKFKEIDDVYHFPNYQIIIRPEWIDKTEDNISYALENGIATVAIRKAILDESLIKIFKAAGLNVMIYTFPQKNKNAKRMLKLGANTVCVDAVKAEDLLN